MIDTSTTAGKIAVMQAFDNGDDIQSRFKSPMGDWGNITFSNMNIQWHWGVQDYRIKPQTVEDAAVMHSIRYADERRARHAINDFMAGSEWQKEQDNE